jgi:FHA domain
MADVSYAPGALTAVVGDQCWALVDAAPDSPAVARIWQQLGQRGAADALLVGLLVDGPGGIPGFTLLVAGSGGQHRLFCRGTVGATVVTGPAETPERIDGAGLLTWHERVLGNAERIFLGVPPADAALRLPATSGVLLAGCVIVDLTNFAARETVSYEPDQPKKTIVLFPDTITMTSPGSLIGRASAGQPMPGDRGPVILPAPPIALPPGPLPPGPLPAIALPPGPVPRGPLPPGPIGPAGPVVPGGHSGGPVRPDIPGSGAFPAPGMPLPAPPRPGMPMTGPMLPPSPMPAPGPGPAAGAMPTSGVPTGAMSLGPVGGLIDAPPWLSGPGGPVPTGAMPSGIPPAGTGPAEPPYQPPVPRAESGPGWPVAMTTPPDRIGPVVPALLCPSGHVNPPSGAACRQCGAPLPHDPVPVPRPVLGVLRLSLGDVIALDRGVLMGRNPRTDFGGTDGEERPHIVKLPSAGGDISRTHLRVSLDGWHVLVTDLNSTNGTLVTLPGRDPQQLRPGEPVPMQPGTVVTLADGIDFRYEVTE